MKKIINWFKTSNRWKHLVVGCAIGLFATDIYCASYAGVATAFGSELKDKQWGGKWDWIDISITLAGVAIGVGINYLIRLAL